MRGVGVERWQWVDSDPLDNQTASAESIGRCCGKKVKALQMEDACDSQVKAVLIHELAHYQRLDNLANLLQGRALNIALDLSDVDLIPGIGRHGWHLELLLGGGWLFHLLWAVISPLCAQKPRYRYVL